MDTNTNINIYEYDKYDIIDFLEPDYIDDWLNLIPDNIWLKYSKSIETQLYKITNKEIILYVVKKINIDLVDLVLKNFDEINIELLKVCAEINFLEFNKKIKMNIAKYNEIILTCIRYHNYEFNKYFYEKVYIRLEPEHISRPKNLWNLFGYLSKNDYHKENMFYKYILTYKNILFSTSDVAKYYDEKFPNQLKNIVANKFTILLKFIELENFNNMNEVLEITNILGINKKDFDSKILFPPKYFSDYTNLLDTYVKNHFVPKVIMSNNLQFIFEVLNYCDSNELKKPSNIIGIMVCIGASNNYENLHIVFNSLTNDLGIIFTSQMLSDIGQKILQNKKKNQNYDKIIYEIINLGGKITGYSHYTDYYQRLRFIDKN